MLSQSETIIKVRPDTHTLGVGALRFCNYYLPPARRRRITQPNILFRSGRRAVSTRGSSALSTYFGGASITQTCEKKNEVKMPPPFESGQNGNGTWAFRTLPASGFHTHFFSLFLHRVDAQVRPPSPRREEKRRGIDTMGHHHVCPFRPEPKAGDDDRHAEVREARKRRSTSLIYVHGVVITDGG